MRVVCDIDGCIADPCDYVRMYLIGPKKDWKEYYRHTLELPRINPIADLVQAIYDSGNLIFYVTGRPESNRKLTLEWLQRNLGTAGQNATDYLFMRRPKDDRKTYEVKVDWYLVLKPTLIIEDEPDAIEAAKAAGFKNVLQVHGYRITERDAIPDEQGEILV